MTGKIMSLRERDTSTVQAAADAFLSSVDDDLPGRVRSRAEKTDAKYSIRTGPDSA